jgi:peptidoglycan/LPS O-acetylase OafA/YrhL
LSQDITLKTPEIQNQNRRHDLDALRAFAMFLGIGLHASLSFVSLPWPVQDITQPPIFIFFIVLVHGFRMPLFFLLSGFFTMMLFRKRNIKSLILQRILRILLPCLIGCFTIIPLLGYVSRETVKAGSISVHLDENSLAGAIRKGDRKTINIFLINPNEIEKPDKRLGVTPLSWAAMIGDLETVSELIKLGADVNSTNKDDTTALHGAAFLGRDAIVKLLLFNGANASKRSKAGFTALEGTFADPNTTTSILNVLGIQPPNETDLTSGRINVRSRLLFNQFLSPDSKTLPQTTETIKPKEQNEFYKRYNSWLTSSFFQINFFNKPTHLFKTSIFHHLWFLWFLCWMLPLFLLFFKLGSLLFCKLNTNTMRILKKTMLYILIPAPLFPLCLMGEILGPDTYTGILPPPHLLFYYMIFFGFGLIYFDLNDSACKLTRFWYIMLPLALFIIFPAEIVFKDNLPLNLLFQTLSVWNMVFGMMGMFHAFIKKENILIRYLSDSSYWIYIVHLPLVLMMQFLVREWPTSAFLKFLLINIATITLLLFSYHLLVRSTWIGWLLNGRMMPWFPKTSTTQTNN